MSTKKWTVLTFALVLVLLVVGLASCAPTPGQPPAPEETEEVAPPEETEEVTEPEPEPTEEMAEPEPTEEEAEPEPEMPADGPKRGGTLRTEYNWIPYVEDPAADGVGTGQVGMAIAEPLVWVGADGQPRPQLVKSWEFNEDATEWTFHLQEGVSFNNGKEFGADDVIWNITHWLDPDTGASAAAKLDMLTPEGIEKVDDLTIKFTLDRPNADFMLAFYDYPTMIAPDGGWEDFYSGDPADAIGTGPWIMEEYIPDERFVLVRNPNYWQMGEDGESLPYIEKVIVTAGWDDAARLPALVGDEIDILTNPGDGIREELENTDGIDINWYARWSAPMVVRVDTPPFDDPRVVQALKLVQDRQRIQELVVPTGFVGYDHWIDSSDASYCEDTDVDGQPQDIEAATTLLAEAGYADGLDLELALPDGDFRTDLAQVYKEMAAEAGINVELNILPSAAFWDQWQTWPFSVTGWNARLPATANISLALRCEAAWTESFYCNEEFDDLLNQVEATADVDARRDLYCQIQQMMQDEGPYLLPIWIAQYGASQDKVQLPQDHGGTWSRAQYLWHYMWLEE
jgi:peptide/nickel transport system substrate-binding protein